MIYCNFQLKRTLDLSEEQVATITYKIDALSAMQTFQHIWKTLLSILIANSKKIFGLLDEINSTAAVKMEWLETPDGGDPEYLFN